MVLAVIAGSGRLPGMVLAQNDAVLVALDGVVQNTGKKPDIQACFERLGMLFESLASKEVREVVFAGAMGRPALESSKFDRVTLEMLPRLMPLLSKGDDALLSGIIAEFEAAGFVVRGSHEIVSGLLVGAGRLGTHDPSATDLSDAARAIAVLDHLSPCDIGQACISCDGQIIGIETLYGTDAMLADVAHRRVERRPQTGGVLVKRAKLGQDLRVDLPTIGPGTVSAAVQAKLSGICVQADHVQIIEKETVIAEADRAGLAIWACV